MTNRTSRKLNILLINPHTPSFVRHRDKSIPIGLLYLASSLEKNDFNVKIIDISNDFLDAQHKGRPLNFDDYFSNYFINQVNSFNPDLVGIGCLFSGRFKTTLFVAEIIKKNYSTLPIVLGGIHPTIFPKEILNNCPIIDYIIIGEGDYSFVELIEAHFNDKRLLKNVDGLAYRKDGKVLINPKTKFIKNLDELSWPAHHLLDLKKYYFDTSNWFNPKNLPINFPLPINSSRSCPNQCTFCSMFLVHGRGFRPRSAKSVVDEIEYIYKKFNHRYFIFIDDNPTVIKQRMMEIAKGIIERGLDIQLDLSNIFLQTVDKEVIDLLLEAGLVNMCIAPENGSDFIRNKAMKKNLSTEAIYKFIDIIRDYKTLRVKAFFVVGYPQETRETLAETFEMIKNIMPPLQQISIFNVVPYPGTELFDYCIKNRLLKVSLRDLYKSEKFSNYNESDQVFIKPYNLKKQEITEFRKEVYNYMNQVRKKVGLRPITF